MFSSEWQVIINNLISNQSAILLNQRFMFNPWKDVISQNSSCVSYKGFDTKTGKCVTIHKISMQNEETIKIKEHESEILTIFTHSNIARRIQHFWDTINGSKCFIIITDHYEEDLLTMIQTHKTNPLVICKWMLQLLNAVEFLHVNEILCCDLNLQNCFVNNKFDLCIGNFGNKVSQASNITSLIGSIETMSPEVLEQGQYGPEQDVWSLGCIWYKLIFGRFPFTNDAKIPIMDQILLGNIDYS